MKNEEEIWQYKNMPFKPTLPFADLEIGDVFKYENGIGDNIVAMKVSEDEFRCLSNGNAIKFDPVILIHPIK